MAYQSVVPRISTKIKVTCLMKRVAKVNPKSCFSTTNYKCETWKSFFILPCFSPSARCPKSFGQAYPIKSGSPHVIKHFTVISQLIRIEDDEMGAEV